MSHHDLDFGLHFRGCVFADAIEFSSAAIADLALDSCICKGRFSADQVRVRWNLAFTNATFELGAYLYEGEFGGRVSFRASEFLAPGDDLASLNADQVTVDGGWSFIEVVAKAETRMLDTQIGGQLVLNDVQFETTSSDQTAAFSADGIHVRGGLHCVSIVSNGDFRLPGAVIDGPLYFNKAELTGRPDASGAITAFTGDGLRVKHDVIFKNASITGELRLLGAKIGGQLGMAGADLRGQMGRGGFVVSLGADLVEVGESMYLVDDFDANGYITMAGAKIAGVFFLGRMNLTGETDYAGLNLINSTIGELRLHYSSIEGTLDLRGAKVTTLADAVSGKLPTNDGLRLRLENFSYEFLREPLNAKRRLSWVEGSQGDGYFPGVFLQLAETFDRIGQSGDGRRVRIASERRAIERMPSWRPRWLWNKLLWITTGSGYRNWLAALWLVLLIALGALLFWCKEASFGALSATPPNFDPVLYSIDATVPVLEVGQQRAWAAEDWVRWSVLFLTVAGYALATAVIAAAAGLINRDSR